MPQEMIRKYINPGTVSTTVMLQDGLTVSVSPYSERKIGVKRNRTYVIEGPRSFMDALCVTGQIAPAPDDLQEDVPDDLKRFQEARREAIEEQRKRRVVLEAMRDEFQETGDLDVETRFQRKLDEMNNPGVDPEAPELDTDHAPPRIEEAIAGKTNLSEVVDEDGQKVHGTEVPVVGIGDGMSRKKGKKPKKH